MRHALFLMLPAALLAVDGTILNQTTGKPQPNVVVQLIQPGQGGMQTLGTAKSGPDGKFKFDQAVGENAALLQAIYGGVTYTKMIPPGSSQAAVEVPVFDATRQPGVVELNQRVIVLQPGADGLQVNEMYLVRNQSKTTFNDPAKGSLQLFVPAGHGELRVNISAPGGMPVQREASPTGSPNVFKIDYPVKPGETRFDVTYPVKTSAGEFSGKNLMKAGETRIVVPDGVNIEGDALTQLGTEPQTKAKIYDVKVDTFAFKVSGSGTLNVDGAAGDSNAGAEEDQGQPKIEQTNPRIYQQLPLVMALGGAILLLGFILLYRSNKA